MRVIFLPVAVNCGPCGLTRLCDCQVHYGLAVAVKGSGEINRQPVLTFAVYVVYESVAAGRIVLYFEEVLICLYLSHSVLGEGRERE